MHRSELPPVTEAHRQQAFERFHWNGWTFTAAMADPLRRREIEARATHLRTEEWKATQKRVVVPVRRCRLGVDGHPVSWATQRVMTGFEPITQPELPIS